MYENHSCSASVFAFTTLLTLLVSIAGGIAQTRPAPNPAGPVVVIQSPTNGATFYPNSDIEMCATANDGTNSITTVQFFAGANSLGTVTNYPVTCSNCLPPIRISFCITWSNVPPGLYTLTAVAAGSEGLMATSAPVDITVSGNSAPPPPLVAIETPTNGASFPANSDIQICAAAGDTNGGVAAVEFFAGATSLGIVSNFVIIDPIGGRPILYHQYFLFFLDPMLPGRRLFTT